jgi:hypothetical protein
MLIDDGNKKTELNVKVIKNRLQMNWYSKFHGFRLLLASQFFF